MIEEIYTGGGQAALDARVKKLTGEIPAGIAGDGARAELPDGFRLMRYRMTFLKSTLNKTRLAVALRRVMTLMPEALRVGPSITDYPHPADEPSAAEALAIIEMMGLTGEIAEVTEGLNPWAVGGTPGEIFPGFCQWVEAIGALLAKNQRGSLAEAMAAKFPNTFGGKLCAAVLQDAAARRERDEEQRRNLNKVLPERVHYGTTLQFLGEHLEQLAKLPEQDQIKFAVLPDGAGLGWRAEPQGLALAAKNWQRGVALIHDRKQLDELLAATPDDWQKRPPGEKELCELLARALPEEPDRIVKLLPQLHAHALTQPGSIYAKNLWWYFSRVQWEVEGPANCAKMTRAALKLANGGLNVWGGATAFEYHLSANLRGWLLPPMRQEDYKRWTEQFVASVESCPDDFLTDAEARSLLPVLLGRMAPLRGHASGLLAAAERLAIPGPGGALRRTAATALGLLALHDARVQKLRDRETMVRAMMKAPELSGFSPQFVGNAVVPGVEDETALSHGQRELLAFLGDVSLSASRRAERINNCLELYPRLFDPPLLYAIVPLWDSGSQGAHEFLPVSLATAALHFTSATTKQWQAAEKRLLTLLQNGDGNRTSKAALAIAARCGTDDEVLQWTKVLSDYRGQTFCGSFRMLVNLRRFAAARWLLENAPDQIFSANRPAEGPHDLYGARTPQNLRDFLATLPEGILRLTTRAVVETASDDPELVELKAVFRNQRLEALEKDLQWDTLPQEWQRRLKCHFDGDAMPNSLKR